MWLLLLARARVHQDHKLQNVLSIPNILINLELTKQDLSLLEEQTVAINTRANLHALATLPAHGVHPAKTTNTAVEQIDASKLEAVHELV